MPPTKKLPEIVDVNALISDEPETVAVTEVVVPGEKQRPPAMTTQTTANADPAAVEALQAQLKALQDELARERGRKDPDPEFAPPEPGEDNVLIHVVGNGFTALGTMWFVGQELEFDRSTYMLTVDKTGRSWLELRNDEAGQIDQYGDVMFRNGPWRGKSYADATGAPLQHPLRPLRDGEPAPLGPSQSELHAAGDAERRRNRGIPRVTAR